MISFFHKTSKVVDICWQEVQKCSAEIGAFGWYDFAHKGMFEGIQLA